MKAGLDLKAQSSFQQKANSIRGEEVTDTTTFFFDILLHHVLGL